MKEKSNKKNDDEFEIDENFGKKNKKKTKKRKQLESESDQIIFFEILVNIF